MAQTTGRIGPLQIGVIGLTLITAFMHLALAFAGAGLVFIFNALGYIALASALYAPVTGLEPRRNLIRYALIAYTALTIALWVVFGARNEIAAINKIVEALLIVLLIVEARKSS